MFLRALCCLMVMALLIACGDTAGAPGPDAADAAIDVVTTSFAGAYMGGYRATRMRAAPSAETTQEDEPAYNIAAVVTAPGRATFQVTETCAFVGTTSGAISTLEVGQRCTGFAGRSAQFTVRGGSAQLDGAGLTLTVTGDYSASGESGTYTWRYVGRRR
ncbi:MAG: hypothetical protein U0324_17795 [Polyangiales bacterium]